MEYTLYDSIMSLCLSKTVVSYWMLPGDSVIAGARGAPCFCAANLAALRCRAVNKDI